MPEAEPVVELVGRLRLVGDHVCNLEAALGVGAKGRGGKRVGQYRRFRERADIHLARARIPELAGYENIRRDLKFSVEGADILAGAEEVAIDEAVEIVAIDAELRKRTACRGRGIRSA